MEAISIAHKTSMLSIVSSGLSFFAATFGVALYSQVDMIGSICTLLARGAVISMLVVILLLPAMFMIFDKLIIKTTFGTVSYTHLRHSRGTRVYRKSKNHQICRLLSWTYRCHAGQRRKRCHDQWSTGQRRCAKRLYRRYYDCCVQ